MIGWRGIQLNRWRREAWQTGGWIGLRCSEGSTHRGFLTGKISHSPASLSRQGGSGLSDKQLPLQPVLLLPPRTELRPAQVLDVFNYPRNIDEK